MYWIRISARLSRICQAGRDADAFVLLADADELEGRVGGDREQQPLAGEDVGHRQHELHAARLDRGEGWREPLSSILSSGSSNKSASMRDPRQEDADAVDIGIDT